MQHKYAEENTKRKKKYESLTVSTPREMPVLVGSADFVSDIGVVPLFSLYCRIAANDFALKCINKKVNFIPNLQQTDRK